jgi:hypothetical protein
VMRPRLRPIFAVMAAVAAVGAVSSPVAAAGQTMPASGGLQDYSFQVISQRSADGNIIQVAKVGGSISGTFVGPYVEDARAVIHANGAGNIAGTATCACMVGAASGTVVFGFNAQAEPDGSLTGHFAIVSATGGLTGLNGHGTISSSNGVSGSYSGEIHF